MFFRYIFPQDFCDSSTPKAIHEQIQVDEHSPNRYRALIPLQNLPDFAKAFNCPTGSKMNPANKCAVWWFYKKKSISFDEKSYYIIKKLIINKNKLFIYLFKITTNINPFVFPKSLSGRICVPLIQLAI